MAEINRLVVAVTKTVHAYFDASRLPTDQRASAAAGVLLERVAAIAVVRAAAQGASPEAFAGAVQMLAETLTRSCFDRAAVQAPSLLDPERPAGRPN